MIPVETCEITSRTKATVERINGSARVIFVTGHFTGVRVCCHASHVRYMDNKTVARTVFNMLRKGELPHIVQGIPLSAWVNGRQVGEGRVNINMDVLRKHFDL